MTSQAHHGARGSVGEPAWHRARRPMALAVVLVAASALGISAYTGLFRICRPEVLTAGERLARTRLCDPLKLADLAPLWILTLALLWPDIRSLTLFGVGLEKRQEQLERDLTALATLTPAEKVSRSLDEKAQAEWPAGSSETMTDERAVPGGEDA